LKNENFAVDVSDRNRMGCPEYRAIELQDIDLENSFHAKTDLYAIGVILEKLIGDMQVSFELKEAVKIATDNNIEGRCNLQ
jgi:hypothetical protein